MAGWIAQSWAKRRTAHIAKHSFADGRYGGSGGENMIPNTQTHKHAAHTDMIIHSDADESCRRGGKRFYRKDGKVCEGMTGWLGQDV